MNYEVRIMKPNQPPPFCAGWARRKPGGKKREGSRRGASPSLKLLRTGENAEKKKQNYSNDLTLLASFDGPLRLVAKILGVPLLPPKIAGE